MVDPGGEKRVGAGGIGSDGRRGRGRWGMGSTVAIGSVIWFRVYDHKRKKMIQMQFYVGYDYRH